MIEFWQRADASPLGIILRTADTDRAKARLYTARGDGFGHISICVPREGELWLVKRSLQGE